MLTNFKLRSLNFSKGLLAPKLYNPWFFETRFLFLPKAMIELVGWELLATPGFLKRYFSNEPISGGLKRGWNFFFFYK